MKNNLFILFGIASAFLAGSTTWAAQTNQATRIGISYRPGYNISARFSGLGGFAAQTAPGPAVAGANHLYDDGFNLLDSSGNFGGRTWNWGYANARQLPGNDTVVMHSSSSAPTASSEQDNADPQHGFELTLNRQLGMLGHCPWGLEVAFNYMDVDVKDNQALSAPVQLISDAYALSGITAPLAPYSGPFSGPGPLLSDAPSRTLSVLPGGAMVSGQRNLDGSAYGLRLGPYLQIPLDQWFSFSLSAGLAVVLVDSDFRYSESVAISGVGSVFRSGASSHSEVLAGGYVGGTLAFAVTEQVSLFAGAQYQNVGKFSQVAAGKKAELDLGKSIFVTVGLSYGF